MRLKDNSGQALIETMMVIVFVTTMCFATIQLCIIVMNELICNETAFTVVRAAVVTRIYNDNRERKELQKTTIPTASLLMLKDINLKNLTFVPTDAETLVGFLTNSDGKRFKDGSDKDIRVYNTNIRYFVNTMFLKLIDPTGKDSYSLMNFHMLQRYSRARMVKSPDEDFYDKPYKGSREYGY